jgi:hypothetical protein
MTTPAAAAVPAETDTPATDAPDTRSRAEVERDLVALSDGDDAGSAGTLADGAGAADELAAKRDAKPAKDEAKPADEDDDVAAIKAINARSRARRLERQRANAPAGSAAPSTPAAAAAPPAAEAKTPPAPAAAKPPVGVEGAVRDVLERIAELAGSDKDAAAAGEQPNAQDTAARAAALTEIRTRLDEIAATSKDSAALKEQVKGLEAQLKAVESTRIVTEFVTAGFDKVADECPTLAGKHNAIGLLNAATNRFYDKYQKLPNVGELARRIEKKLQATAPENDSDEKPQTKTRKTVTSSLGSPPAARQGPDTRTSKQVEADLLAAFNLE